MQILNTITVYMTVAFVLMILIIFAFVMVYVLANRKKTSISEIYYDSFERRDSMEYLKFDEIISSDPEEPMKGAGIMVVNKNTFIAALSVTGYNFFQSSYDAQVNTINSTISFMDALENPISMRQTVKAINISHNIEEHKKQVQRLIEEIEDLRKQILYLTEDAEDCVDDDPEASQEYLNEAHKLQFKYERKSRQYEEALEMIRYMEEISTLSGDSQRVQHIIYSYVYDSTQFTNQLTQEEIVFHAMQELDNRAAALSSSLFRCGCTARRCSAEELVDLNRRHLHPATADDYTIAELFHSDIGSLFVTSQSLLDKVKEQMTEDAYRRELMRVNAQMAEEMKRTRLLAERAEADRIETTMQMVAPTIRL